MKLSQIANYSRWIFASAFANRALKFFIKIILTKILLPEDFGVVTLRIMSLDLLSLLAGFGISVLVYSKEEEGNIQVTFS